MATGANAEFGRSAGGDVNVITKSGTNEFQGSLFDFQRLEALTSEASDGNKLTDFHREQFGVSVGGPIKGVRVSSRDYALSDHDRTHKRIAPGRPPS